MYIYILINNIKLINTNKEDQDIFWGALPQPTEHNKYNKYKLIRL